MLADLKRLTVIVPIERLQIINCVRCVGKVGNVRAPRGPPVRLHVKNVSIFPNSIRPPPLSLLQPGTLFKIAQLQPAKVGAQRQASLRAKAVLSSSLAKTRDFIAHPRVLPNYCVAHREARLALPTTVVSR